MVEKKLKGLGGNKKKLLEFGGYKSIRQAQKETGMEQKEIYDYLLEQYNEVVEQLNQEEKDKKLKLKKEKQQKEKLMKKENDIKNKLLTGLNDLKNEKIQKYNFNIGKLLKINKNKKETLTYLLKNINEILTDKLVDIRINGKIYSLNKYTSQRLYNLIQSGGVQVEVGVGSDAEVVYNLSKASNNIVIELFKPTNKNNKYNGAFFPYLHKTKFDLGDYQIYNSIQKNYDNCLVHALFYGGVSKNELQEIKMSCNTDNIPICELENICKKLKIKILLKRENL